MSEVRAERTVPGAWRLLLIGCAAVVTAVEMTLLWLGSGYLTNGFNTVSLTSFFELAAFGVASTVLDVVLILAVWIVFVPLASRIASPLPVFFCAGALAIGVPLALYAARQNLYAIVGDMFDVALMNQVGSATWSSLAIEALAGARVVWGVAFVAGLAALVGVAWWLARYERRHGPFERLRVPYARRIARPLAATVVVALPLLLLPGTTLHRLRVGLERKPAAALLMTAMHRVFDVDGDGYDAFTRPPDPAPWAASVHPYALDVPGNGVDEDGLAGDLPRASSPQVDYPPPEPLSARPHLLILFLESFRADLLDRDLDGEPIAPFLRRLAEEGARSEHAWAQSPWTLSSRSQLFHGNPLAEPGATTLIDDFKAWGYRVAHYSGQDESYGDSEQVLGTARADAFYDARRDVDRRTSRSTAPVSLQVSWKTLLERVGDELAGLDPARPTLLYVNIVDTHFPYAHAQLDDVLGVAPLDRDEIRSHNAERVFRGYANTAANVDRAARRLVEAWRARLAGADHAIVVLADHGQAFYEQGTLGHGQSVGAAEARLPFIVWGIGGDWPEPIAPKDVRGLLRRHLGRERGESPPRPRFVPDPERLLLQYAPHVERPSEIALRGVDGAWVYDFGHDRFAWIGPDGVRRPLDRTRESDRFAELVRRWETLALENARFEAR